jgi:hypothetical protein
VSEDKLRANADPLSAFAMMIGGAFAAALPMTIVIVWICS